jgi:ATP-dependent DNA helicase RecG
MHHFLSAADLAWLDLLPGSPFDKDEKMALVFLREVGAINNAAYRDLSGVEGHRATSRLRRLTDLGLVLMKGHGRGAYYVPSSRFLDSLQASAAESDKVPAESDKASADSAAESAAPPQESADALFELLPEPLQQRVAQVGRYQDKKDLKDLIEDLCSWRPLGAKQIARLLDRNRRYVEQHYLSEMVAEGRLALLHPDMPSHANQAYVKKAG